MGLTVPSPRSSKAVLLLACAGLALTTAHAAPKRYKPQAPNHPSVARNTISHRPIQHRDDAITVSTNRAAFQHGAAQHIADSTTRLTAAILAQHHVTTLKDLQNLAPNVTIQSLLGTASTNFFIRGVGLNDYTQNNTSSVLTYIDDIPFIYSTMANGMMFDVSGVDVSPGPTGFTHGLAATGGEIGIHTNDPTSDWHGGINQDIASYARSQTDFFISGPLARHLSFRIAGQSLQGGGWQNDPLNGTHMGNAKEGALRAKLLWTPDAKTSVRLTGHWTQDDSQVLVAKPVVNFLPKVQQNLPQLAYNQASWDLKPGFANLIGRSTSLYPSEHNTFWGFDLNIQRDLGFATLQSVSGFQTEREGEYTDQDGTTYATGDTYRNIVANTFSQEIKLKSHNETDRLQWDIGMLYDRSRMTQQFFFDFTQYLPARGYYSETSFAQNQQAFSQYAHATYALPHGVKIFAVLNHESDDRRIFNFDTNHFNVHNYIFQPEAAEANQFSGGGGAQWQATERFMLYGKITKGFKPGGFTGNNTVVQSQIAPFKPESLLAYEIGFKSEPIRNVLRLNAAAFYYDYHDQQYIASVLIPGYGPLGKFVNVPKSEIFGAEFSADFHPLKHIYLTQNLGYERGKYQKFSALNSAQTTAYYAKTGIFEAFMNNYNGVDTGIPKLTLNGTADYRTPLFGHDEIDLGLDWIYRGAQALIPGGQGPYALPAYFLMGTHLTWHAPHDRWYVGAYASNILNREYATTGGQATTTYFRIPGPPRFIGGRLGFAL